MAGQFRPPLPIPPNAVAAPGSLPPRMAQQGAGQMPTPPEYPAAPSAPDFGPARQGFSQLSNMGVPGVSPETEEADKRAIQAAEEYGRRASAYEDSILTAAEEAQRILIERKTKHDILREDRAAFEHQAWSDIEDERLEAKYANSNLKAEEIRRLEAIANTGTDPDAQWQVSDDEQKSARDTLDRASSIGDRRPAGKRLMAAIAAGLGAYGAALSKTPNYALQIIQDSIARDISEQRWAFESKQGRYQGSINSLERKLKHFGDMESAIMGEYDEQLQIAGIKLESLKSSMNTQENILKAKQTIAEISATRDQIAQQRVARLADIKARAAQGLATTATAVAKGQTGVSGAAIVLPSSVRVLPGYEVDSKSVAEARKNIIAPYAAIKNLVAETQKLRASENGPTLMKRWVVREQKMNAAVIQGSIRILMNWGARLEEREQAALNALISGDPTEVGFQMDALKSLERLMFKYANSQLKDGYNLELIDTPAGQEIPEGFTPDSDTD